jgi:hypothetical protein
VDGFNTIALTAAEKLLLKWVEIFLAVFGILDTTIGLELFIVALYECYRNCRRSAAPSILSITDPLPDAAAPPG